MSTSTTTFLIALAGGVGGALLTGIFNALIGVLSDRRKREHDLDAWLRERRFMLSSELLDAINDASAEVLPTKRVEWAGDVHDRYVRLMLVAPDSVSDLLQQSVKVVRDELSGEPSVRSSKAIAWQSAYLQFGLAKKLGWRAEPLGVRRERGSARAVRSLSRKGLKVQMQAPKD